jgi:hypothetical protein
MASRKGKGGLRAPRVSGVGEKEGQDIHNRWQTYQEVKKYIENDLGFAPAAEPEFPCPQLTTDKLTTPDSKSYTETYAELLAWWQYASEKLAHVKAELLEVEDEMDDITVITRKRIRKEDKNKKKDQRLSLADISDTIESDIRFIELKQRKQTLAQFKEILGTRTVSIERSLKVISRQVEIRKLDFDQSQVASGMPGRGRRQMRS